ncbi:protein 4.1 homolog [Anticarsia gemmatalis]|uniref:protein 4.1 homolog n=1 Tax=Anticarsia gemmatalis TaxID=129554 RepID=UPI003F77232B
MRESLRRLAHSSDENMARRGRNNTRRVRVELMDAEHITIDIDRKARGGDLLDKICESLDVIEKDYFGMLYVQRGDTRVWLDLNRRLAKTFKNEPWDVRFAVKFYPPEPSELKDDATRYQIALAVRRDLIENRLTCSQITYALLSSYVLQAELGDFEESSLTPSTLSQYRAVPLAAITPELENKIEDLYKKHKGQTPAEAELNYLESAKRLALYGAELHAVTDSEDVDISLAVSHSGIAVYRDGMLMNRFPWAKITKICYNKRLFTLRLRAGEFDQFETSLSFRTRATTACKKLWRCSVEHHMFFRREAPVVVDRIPGLARLGSRRISCRRTLRQLRQEDSPPTAASA